MSGLFRMNGTAAAALQPRVHAYYFKQWNGFRMPFHRHDDATEIMYVMNGTCRVELETASFELKKGEFIVVGFGVPHRLLVEQSCRMLNVEFSFAESGSDETSLIGAMAQGEHALDSLLASAAPYLVLRDPDEVYHALKSLVLELVGRSIKNVTIPHRLIISRSG